MKLDKGEESTGSEYSAELIKETKELMVKVQRLKDYAISQGEDIPLDVLNALNKGPLNLSALRNNAFNEGDENRRQRSDFDRALSELTRLTHPVTIDNLSSEDEPVAYRHFKNNLFVIGIVALALAIYGFYLSVTPEGTARLSLDVNVQEQAKNGLSRAPGENEVNKETTPDANEHDFTQVTGRQVGKHQIGNSLLALGLGLLGAVVYSLFNVLRIISPKGFIPTDAYSNYARILLGLLLGWLFYFSFAIGEFSKLDSVFSNTEGVEKPETIMLLIPFLAGYSTKFVISLLERIMVALEVALGVEEKRDRSIRRAKSASK